MKITLIHKSKDVTLLPQTTVLFPGENWYNDCTVCSLST